MSKQLQKVLKIPEYESHLSFSLDLPSLSESSRTKLAELQNDAGFASALKSIEFHGESSFRFITEVGETFRHSIETQFYEDHGSLAEFENFWKELQDRELAGFFDTLNQVLRSGPSYLPQLENV